HAPPGPPAAAVRTRGTAAHPCAGACRAAGRTFVVTALAPAAGAAGSAGAALGPDAAGAAGPSRPARRALGRHGPGPAPGRARKAGPLARAQRGTPSPA